MALVPHGNAEVHPTSPCFSLREAKTAGRARLHSLPRTQKLANPLHFERPKFRTGRLTAVPLLDTGTTRLAAQVIALLPLKF